MKTEIRIVDNFIEDTHEIYISQTTDNGTRLFADPIEFSAITQGTIHRPTLSFRRSDNIIRKLKHELYKLGALNNADEQTIEAMQKHLDDLRKIVFNGKST